MRVLLVNLLDSQVSKEVHFVKILVIPDFSTLLKISLKNNVISESNVFHAYTIEEWVLLAGNG